MYDAVKDEQIFYYPQVFKSYILTLSSKSFKGLSKELGIQLLVLTKQLGFAYLIFLGDSELAWLRQNNNYKPANNAQEYLVDNKIGRRFNGALQVDHFELPTFVRHISWLIRCNADLPNLYFTDGGQNLIGNICKYGNLHIDTLNEATDKSLEGAIIKSNFKFLNGNNCYNMFGKTGAIAGRRTIP